MARPLQMKSIRQSQISTLPLEVCGTFQKKSMMAVRRIVVAFREPLVDQKGHLPGGSKPPSGVERRVFRGAQCMVGPVHHHARSHQVPGSPRRLHPSTPLGKMRWKTVDKFPGFHTKRSDCGTLPPCEDGDRDRLGPELYPRRSPRGSLAIRQATVPIHRCGGAASQVVIRLRSRNHSPSDG